MTKLESAMPLEDDDILVVAETFWGGPRRVRHKMPIAWAKLGNRILWVEQAAFPPNDWKVPGRFRRAVFGRLEAVAEGLWVGAAPPAIPRMYAGGLLGNRLRGLHRPAMLHRIRRYLRELNLDPSIVILMQQAARYDVLSAFPDCVTIYYCHDLYGYGEASKAALVEERRCCESVDMVWTTSEAHRRRLGGFNPRTVHIPHAIDLDWWERGKGVEPPEYTKISSPRAVYTGAVQAKKVDFGLLAECARAKPEWSFVLVGGVEDKEFAADAFRDLQNCTNVHFLGQRPFESLPGYIAGADALLLPYRDWENARLAGLPAKFFEYLISGKPIVTTPFTRFEIDEGDLLSIAADIGGWTEALDAALAEDDPDKVERRCALARANSEEVRVQLQRRVLAEFLGAGKTIRRQKGKG